MGVIDRNKPKGPDGILSVDAGMGTDIYLLNPELNKRGVLKAIEALKVLVEGDSIAFNEMVGLAQNITDSIDIWNYKDRLNFNDDLGNNTVNELKWE